MFSSMRHTRLVQTNETVDQRRLRPVCPPLPLNPYVLRFSRLEGSTQVVVHHATTPSQVLGLLPSGERRTTFRRPPRASPAAASRTTFNTPATNNKPCPPSSSTSATRIKAFAMLQAAASPTSPHRPSDSESSSMTTYSSSVAQLTGRAGIISLFNVHLFRNAAFSAFSTPSCTAAAS
ncbi:hypothetical protein BJY52DRAFT_1274109 [Lactarius psammicola]|nr:hypothetical protein BJY52DRAFT_1274109 [Lactarius psammicola]